MCCTACTEVHVAIHLMCTLFCDKIIDSLDDLPCHVTLFQCLSHTTLAK